MTQVNLVETLRREKKREYQAAYLATHRETARAATLAWARDNPERKKAQNRAQYLANRKARIKASAEQAGRHKSEHPEAYAADARRRASAYRARKRDAFVEHVDPRVVLDRDGGVCGICGLPVDPVDFHVDHVIALARGGEHSYANVQTAHPRCNKSKAAA